MTKSGWVKTVGPLIVILLALVVAVVLIMSKKPPEEKPLEKKDLLVEASPFYRQSASFVISSQGNVVPKSETRLSSQVSGQVVRIADVFVAGGMFNEGDVLAVLEQDDYQTEMKLAEAELAQAKAALEEEIARGIVAEKEWRSVNSVVPPSLGLRKPQLAREQANVKAAEAKYERAKRNLARTEIRAPYDGIVIKRSIDIGQFIGTGTEVGTLYSTDVAEVRLPITESELAFIDINGNLQAAATVAIRAVVAGETHQWQAKLVRTEGILDSGSRVIYAIAEVSDPYNRSQSAHNRVLRFGQFVEASIASTQTQSLFVLPRSALRLDGTVLTVGKDNTLKIKDVDVARATAKQIYLRGGIDEGEKVILSVVPNPYDGMKLRVAGDELLTEGDKPSTAEQPITLNDEGRGNE
ncbi:efflux RND transporter periplasmic adaptor subunit [Aestuariibacter sp. A3R04]|uniref:efflux RND transporter periplasmic adaptor subunit n=1 Tax=Aestuariibacter sp. A3R04 TaxID=2841571 RepID=UPI001C09E7E6|nr:efflux RND transporter periplasmic adaptor subunit [Aestuariibacter sp. A3R04]MBU3022758.1 efflux RND transporter periplasmic adaptor subunit [Aestuariibacter sp. A3R04]